MVLLAISYFNTLAKINDFVATLAKLVNFTTLVKINDLSPTDS